MTSDSISYLSILPDIHGIFEEEYRSCLDKLADYTSLTHTQAFKITIFIHSQSNTDFQEKLRILQNAILCFFHEKCPTFSVLPQSPEGPYQLAMEVAVIGREMFDIEFKKYLQLPYILIKTNNTIELWISGISCAYSPLEKASQDAFEILNNILLAEKMGFDDIVRQWNYIGGILETQSSGQTFTQNYQIFNEVRHTYYQKYRKVKGFPAATGIGKKYEGLVIDCYAFQASEANQVYSVVSPVQRNAYEYDQEILIGMPLSNDNIKHAPAFERGKVVKAGYISHFFISGTASINGQNTVEIGDTRMQTIKTIANMDALASASNIQSQFPELCITSTSFRYVRIYMKSFQDIEKVKALCKSHFGKAPLTFVEADICREELLIELETELGID